MVWLFEGGGLRLPRRIQVQARDFARRGEEEGEGMPMRNPALEIGRPLEPPSFAAGFLRGHQGFICSDVYQGRMSA